MSDLIGQTIKVLAILLNVRFPSTAMLSAMISPSTITLLARTAMWLGFLAAMGLLARV
jgi:hypothetical protein